MQTMENYQTLDQLKPNESAIIQEMKGQEPIHYRLRELGMVTGTEIVIKRFAPMGDPMEIVLRGYRLSIRKEDARQILVKKI